MRRGTAGRLLPLLLCCFTWVSCTPPAPRPLEARESPEVRQARESREARDAGTWASFEGGAAFAVAPPSASAADAHAAGLRTVAESYLKVPYRFGGQGRDGMDCSGFVRQVFEEAYNLRLPRNSAAMARYGRSVPRGELRPGDLVFFKRTRIDHVGIYMGDGYFIHSQSRLGVTYTRLDEPWFSTRFAEAKRLLP